MLHANCGSCGSPLPLDQVHEWIAAAAVCGAECAAALNASGEAIRPMTEHETEALRLTTVARRTSNNVGALEQLVDDRSMRASKIIGLTKAARREKRALEDKAREFQDASDSARYEHESALVELMGHLMALRDQAPELTQMAVGLASGFARVGYPGTESALSAVEGAVSGESSPLRRAVIEEGRWRAERHRDGVFVYESQSHKSGDGAIWTLEKGICWGDISKVEYVDRSIELRDKAGLIGASLGTHSSNRDKLFTWVREERPDLTDAERAMTGFEALSVPGCVLAVVLAVGGALGGVLTFFDVAMVAVLVVLGLTALLGAGAFGYGVKRFVNRPRVQQLVSPAG